MVKYLGSSTSHRLYVRDHLAVTQHVHGEAGRRGYELELLRAEVEPRLQVGAGGGEDGKAGQVGGDRPVHVARHEPAHLRVALDDCPERAAVLGGQPDCVQRRDPRDERRMVHGDQGGHAGLGCQLRIEPREPLLVQGAVILARPGGVDHDEPQRAEVGRVLDGLVVHAGDVEVAAEGGPVVVVAREDVDRHVERREELEHLLVLGIGGVLREIAGDKHGVRPRPQRLDRLDRGGERGDGIAAAPVGPEVRIAELREQKRRAILLAGRVTARAWRERVEPADDRRFGLAAWHDLAVTGRPAAEQHLQDLARLRRVRDRIDREYAQPLDVEALARDAHMSAGHFSREFRRAYGESPYGYLMTRRIERAMALLRRGDLSVTEVCFEVGCSSLGTFSTRFTELVGVPPSDYRRNAAGAMAGIPPCVAKRVTKPIRNREAPVASRS